ncbi:MAG: hypothetical protein ABW352_11370 [Polyangiales bacterium]
MRQAIGWGVLMLAACGNDSDSLGQRVQQVETVCVDSAASVPAGGWQCGQPLTVACGAELPPLYVSDSCGSVSLQATGVRTDVAGPQTVNVLRANGSSACSSTVTVTAGAPAITPRTINLWPPNHKLHTITVEDCIGDYAGCDPDVRAEFVWASSDEPIDSIGDGHHAPDIVFACDSVQVRSERQGPKDGRVYKLGVRVTDRLGAATESVCSVIVDHDQRGVLGADSGEAYRVTFDGSQGTPLCTDVPRDAGAPPVLVPDASTPVVGY